jgi:hypothetical protein
MRERGRERERERGANEASVESLVERGGRPEVFGWGRRESERESERERE